jgi:ParB family chromosome partitioning protein
MTSPSKTKPRGLGRGLNALFEDEEKTFSSPSASAEGAAPAPARGRVTLGIEQLVRNEAQPREHFDEEGIQQLAESLQAHGMLQPILARKRLDGKFEIIAGERRWRAAQKARLHEVPVNIVEFDDKKTLEVGLIENLQREDLNPVEEARGYQRLSADYGMTQEDISKSIGKSRSHIANMTRLLNLPPVVLEYLEKGQLSAGHARALITAPNAAELAREIVEKGLNVRATEERVAAMPAGGSRRLGKNKYQKDADTIALENDLSNALGMKVTIDAKDEKSGVLKVDFKSLNQLDDVIQRLTKIPKVILAD